MGWRDINMNRRKPPLRPAAVPVEAGQTLREAVLRKACGAALACLEAQSANIHPDAFSWFRPFAAGYLAGFARHQALKHGVDAEQGDGTPMHGLLQVLSPQAPSFLADEIARLRFLPRAGFGKAPRTGLRAEAARADAGYLVGHLESLCGSRRLLKAAAEPDVSEIAVDAFLTACDTAADRMQTHQPTMSLRFDPAERALLRSAFAVVD